MKSLIKTSGLLLAFMVAFCCTPFSVFGISKSILKKFHPPGTVYLKNNLFMDETEINNIHYKEFLFDLKHRYGEESEQYIKAAAIPEDAHITVVHGELTESISLDTYRNHPSYFYYPLVGITYEQAVSYCQWRTKKVNEILYYKYNKNVVNVKDETIPQMVQYRLPTREEWVSAAASGLNPRYQNKLSNLGLPGVMINGKFIGGFFSNGSKSAPGYVWTTPEDLTGCRNMYGNVAEMLSEEGKCIGGSYQTELTKLNLLGTEEFEGANMHVGFRCIAEIVNLEQ